MKPLLFLDVDGVLNCLGAAEGTYDRFWEQGVPFSVCVPHGTKERLAKVLPLFEPVWATAWLGKAHRQFRAHLDLSEESWPYVQFLGLKLPELLKYARGRPWAWVDDDAEWELRQLSEHFRELPNSLVLIPDGKIGLTDEHAEQLVAFAKVHAEDAE